MAAASAHPTEWVAGFASTKAIPLGAFAHLMHFQDHTSLDGLEELRRLRRRLTESHTNARPLLVVDDAFMLDDSSAALLYDVATAGRSFVVVTVQTGKWVPESVSALSDEGVLRHVDLQPLTESEAAELVSLALSGTVDGATLRWLWTTSGGNPLFLRELTLAGTESATLVETEGVWRWNSSEWTGCSPMTRGPRLSSVIQTRLGRLRAGEREAIEIVALAEPLGVGLLRRLVGDGPPEALERRGLLKAAREGRRTMVRLAHPFYAEVLRCEIPTLRAEAIRRRLAEALDATGARRSNDLLVRATWSLDGGGTTTHGLLTEAAWKALETSNYALAERLAREAHRRGGGFDCQLALAQGLIGQRHFEAGETVLHELSKPPDGENRVLAVTTRAENLFWGLAQPERAEEFLGQAVGVETQSAVVDEFGPLHARFLLSRGSSSSAIKSVAPAWARADASDVTVVQSALAVAPALALDGSFEDALGLLDVALAADRRCERHQPPVEAQLLWARSSALAWAGRLAEARVVAEDAHVQAVQRGDRDLIALSAIQLGNTLLLEGNATSALHQLQDAALVLRGHHGWGFRNGCAAVLAQAAALCGRPAMADAALAADLDLARPFLASFAYAGPAVRAWVAYARGESATARRFALEGAAVARLFGHDGLEAIALHDAARLGAAAEVATRLEQLAAVVDGRLISTCAANALAAAGDDGAGLDIAAASFEEMGFMLYAAEASAGAAVAHHRQGRRASAFASRSRYSDRASRCEGTRGVVYLSSPALPALMAREKEVASMAAHGLSSPEIARRLTVSVRTVDNHLNRIYSKLGIAGRTELNLR